MLFKLFTIGALVYLLYRVSTSNSLQEPKEEDTVVIKKPKKEKKAPDDDYVDYEEID